MDGRLNILFGGGAFWARTESWTGNAGSITRLAEDAPEFDGSVRTGGGNAFYAVGTDRLGELQAYNSAREVWQSLLDGISVDTLEYSPDGERVAYVTYPQRTLWVRQTNGKRPIQLTSPPLEAAFPRWSRDGRRIAFSAAESPDKPMRLYIVDADGGPVKPAIPSAGGSQGYPSWSPDGKTLIYGIVSTSLREEVYIRVADLTTGKVTKLEGSDGLFAPRWAPDGSMIAALPFSGDRNLMILNLNHHRWQAAAARRVDWPSWSPDSRSVLCRSGDLVLEYRVDTGKFQTITTMKPEEIGGYSHWIGIGPGGAPLRTLNRDSRQIYSLQLDPR
jgi:dipeptidyl aminopeptidase/acylaminoacyl peptidase